MKKLTPRQRLQDFKKSTRLLLKLAQHVTREPVEELITALREILALQPNAPQGSYVRELVNCGKVKCKKCLPGKPGGHGPYWYFYRTEGHKTIKKYIGKNLPEGVTPPPSQVDPNESVDESDE